MRLLFVFGLMLWLSPPASRAQSSAQPSPLHYEAELGGMATTTDRAPFWLRTNQYGIVPSRGPFGTIRTGLYRTYRPATDTSKTAASRKVDWGFGLNVVGTLGPRDRPETRQLLWPELYGKIRYGKVELFVGRRREVYGLGDTLLTSGFIGWSGNAIPFPKVQIYTPDYIPLRFLKNVLSFKGGYAHGWFTASYIQGVYLHQKFLYGRLGKPNWKVKFYAGLNHQVQWGGRADYLVGTPLAVNGKLPTSFNDYVSLVTGRYPEAISTDQFTDFDGTNRIGNHVGSYDFALEWTRPNRTLTFYHQHLYEDASGLAFQNFPDGLTGIRLHNRLARARFRVERLALEFLTTTNQGGAVFDMAARYQGADNYFNHSQYREGWSYNGRTVGTPFIAPRTEFTTEVNRLEGGGFFPNNRVVAWHLGTQAVVFRNVTLTAKASTSRNFGTFNQRYVPPFRQFSSLLSAQIHPPRWSGIVLTTAFALDQGELYPNTFASYVSVKKSW
ncbi:hypothetical protein DYU11_02760 [Fibrisoma montanum]|uniref:Capsule assembly Wzi family protein n=1 Tax=Fibrisoma montanum TaxID=2305895 RepID=A0A418MIJ7_9BACT|nr:capsule assembly Wzi family protein [Fibrisoma montanum]RIV27250.1 hypothetical protein DYU11_02760 [Fibrisoma montanum]